MKTILKKSFLWWLPLPVIGMLNGMFRGVLLNKIFPDYVAHQFSSLLMVVWILLYIEAVYGKLNYQQSSHAWGHGTYLGAPYGRIRICFGLFYFRIICAIYVSPV